MEHVKFKSYFGPLAVTQHIALRDEVSPSKIKCDSSVFISSARAATTTRLERTTVFSSHSENEHRHEL